MNAAYFGAGDPNAAGAAKDAVFTWFHQDIGLFLMPAIVLVMLAVERLAERDHPVWIGAVTIACTSLAFLAGLTYIVVDPSTGACGRSSNGRQQMADRKANGDTLTTHAENASTKRSVKRFFAAMTAPHRTATCLRRVGVSRSLLTPELDSQRPRTHARGQRAPAIASGSDERRG